MSSKRILVTGGGGYVGSRLIRSLLGRGDKTVILDLMLFGEDHLADLIQNPNVKIIRGDIRNDVLLKKALKDVDMVVHLAGLSNDPQCELDPRQSWQVNLEAPILLAELAREAGVGRFIYACSTSVYGKFDTGEATEDTPVKPLSLYAELKVAVESVILKRNREHFDVVSLRPATLCGYSPRMRFDLALNTFAKQAWFDGEITVHGGSQMRPCLTVDNMVHAYECVLDADSKDVAGCVYNVTQDNYTVMELAYLARDTVRPEARIRVTDHVDPRSYRVNSSRIREKLGFEPKQTLTEALLELRKVFESGEITDPDAPIYRNVALMKEITTEQG